MLLFNNYSAKARWILLNKNRHKVKVMMHFDAMASMLAQVKKVWKEEGVDKSVHTWAETGRK